jgi:hypothetical protein
MAPVSPLVAETEAIVKQFEYTDEDVNKGVKEFLRQMSTSCLDARCVVWSCPACPEPALRVVHLH